MAFHSFFLYSFQVQSAVSELSSISKFEESRKYMLHECCASGPVESRAIHFRHE